MKNKTFLILEQRIEWNNTTKKKTININPMYQRNWLADNPISLLAEITFIGTTPTSLIVQYFGEVEVEKSEIEHFELKGSPKLSIKITPVFAVSKISIEAIAGSTYIADISIYGIE